jgi:hypothetical protein
MQAKASRRRKVRAVKKLMILALLGATSTSTPGCAVLLTGYLVGDAMAKSKATDSCRANLKTQNDARIAKNQDPFPDMCAQ